MKKQENQPAPKPTATLDDLFVKVDGVADNDLAAALKGRVQVQSEGEHVYVEGSFAKAPIKQRLLAVGLGLHALCRKGFIDKDGLFRSVAWFAEHLQEMPATVAQDLSRLKRKQYFEKNKESGYRIPLWALQRAIEFLDD